MLRRSTSPARFLACSQRQCPNSAAYGRDRYLAKGLDMWLNAMSEAYQVRCPGKWSNMNTGQKADPRLNAAVFRFAWESDAETFDHGGRLVKMCVAAVVPPGAVSRVGRRYRKGIHRFGHLRGRTLLLAPPLHH